MPKHNEFDLVAPSVLVPYEFNSRNHSEAQVDLIAKSILDFGFNQPIVVDEENVILVGHGRLLAALKLDLKQVPIVKLQNLSEEQKKAYRILDNKLQNDSTWNFDNLGLELGFLEDNDFPLQDWGLDSLQAMLSTPEQEPIEDDFNPAFEEESYIKLGDIVKLGRHVVQCADVSHLPGVKLPVSFDLWITDPPYGVSYTGKTKKALTIESDDLDPDDIENLWREATTFALDNLKEGASCYASIPGGPLNFNFLKVWVELGIIRQQLIWVKDSMVLGHSDYHYKHEPILYGWKPGGGHYFTEERTKTTILEFDRPKASREHPTMKPILLWAEMIKNSTKQNGWVLDTFLGSGTTLIACEQLNRSCYGIEIDPRYVQVVIERYKEHCKFAGKAFECTINGEKFSGTSHEATNR